MLWLGIAGWWLPAVVACVHVQCRDRGDAAGPSAGLGSQCLSGQPTRLRLRNVCCWCMMALLAACCVCAHLLPRRVRGLEMVRCWKDAHFASAVVGSGAPPS
eukprot:3932900-Alexandrium_andersonii.AAC.1